MKGIKRNWFDFKDFKEKSKNSEEILFIILIKTKKNVLNFKDELQKKNQRNQKLILGIVLVSVQKPYRNSV